MWLDVMCVLQCPFRRKDRASREEVERRVREDPPAFSEKFSESSKLFCSQVRGGRRGRRKMCGWREEEDVWVEGRGRCVYVHRHLGLPNVLHNVQVYMF